MNTLSIDDAATNYHTVQSVAFLVFGAYLDMTDRLRGALWATIEPIVSDPTTDPAVRRSAWHLWNASHAISQAHGDAIGGDFLVDGVHIPADIAFYVEQSLEDLLAEARELTKR